MVFAGFMFGTAIAPYFFGAIFDRTGTYQAALGVSAALILVLCVVLALLRASRPFIPTCSRSGHPRPPASRCGYDGGPTAREFELAQLGLKRLALALRQGVERRARDGPRRLAV